MRRFARALAGAVLLAGLYNAAAAQDQSGGFDFYVLALSWSPTWCATDGRARETAQCDGGQAFGFVVHGLWPQYESGYPEFCPAGRAHIPSRLADSMLDIMPDRRLVFAQWRKHGGCTGLPAPDYLDVTRQAFERIVIPDAFREPVQERSVSAEAVERAFANANEGLSLQGIAVACEAGWLEEVRICLGRDLDFRPCPEVDRRGCRQSELRLPAPG